MGLSDSEFWASTLAKVTALHRVKVLEWDQNRDYFVADLRAGQLNAYRREKSDKMWTPEELLARVYPSHRSPSSTHDPDFGAAGDWRSLKAGLKGTTSKARSRKAKLKVHNG